MFGEEDRDGESMVSSSFMAESGLSTSEVLLLPLSLALFLAALLRRDLRELCISSWSKSLSLKFNSERSIVRLSFSLFQISSGCFFMCPTVLKSALSGKRLIPLGMGGTGFVPFRPLREEGDLTKEGMSWTGVVFFLKIFSCRVGWFLVGKLFLWTWLW